MPWFTAFLLSRSSGWLAVTLLACIAAAGWYIKDLQIDAARCEGKEEIRGQLEQLTDRVVEDIKDETDEKIRTLNQTSDACLDAELPESIVDGLRAD